MKKEVLFPDYPLKFGEFELPFELGIRLFKCIFRESPMKELDAIWSDIEPMTFAEVNRLFTTIEQKRTAFQFIGLERMIGDLNPILVSAESLSKSTSWVQPDGSILQHHFTDTYEIYRVEASDLWGSQAMETDSREQLANAHFVKCRDTSTGKEYVELMKGES